MIVSVIRPDGCQSHIELPANEEFVPNKWDEIELSDGSRWTVIRRTFRLHKQRWVAYLLVEPCHRPSFVTNEMMSNVANFELNKK